MEDMKLVKSLN